MTIRPFVFSSRNPSPLKSKRGEQIRKKRKAEEERKRAGDRLKDAEEKTQAQRDAALHVFSLNVDLIKC